MEAEGTKPQKSRSSQNPLRRRTGENEAHGTPSCQSDALDCFAEHVTILTNSLKEVTVTKEEMTIKEEIKELEIASNHLQRPSR